MPSLEDLLQILRLERDPARWNINIIVGRQKLAQNDAQRAYNLDPQNPWANYAFYMVSTEDSEPPETLKKEINTAINYDPERGLILFPTLGY